MNVLIVLLLVVGVCIFLWGNFYSEPDPNLEQIPMFIIGFLMIALSAILFVGKLILSYFTGG